MATPNIFDNLDDVTLPEQAESPDIFSDEEEETQGGLSGYLTALKNNFVQTVKATRASQRAASEFAQAENAYTPSALEDTAVGRAADILLGAAADTSFNPVENSVRNINALGDAFNTLITEPAGGIVIPGIREAETARRQRAMTEATAAAEEAQAAGAEQQEAAAVLGEGGIAERLTRAAGSVAAQPEQLGSLAGGVVGSIAGPGGTAAGAAVGSVPMAKNVYDSAYAEARQNFGATKEEAQAYGAAIAAVEFGTEAIGGEIGSAAIKRLGMSELTQAAARKGLERIIASRTGRIIGASAAEGVQEGLTELGGDVLREGMEAADALSSEDSRERLKQINAANAATRLDRVLDSSLAGAIGGGAIAAPAAHVQFAYEAGQQMGRTSSAAIEGFDRARSEAEQNAVAFDDRLNTELASYFEAQRSKEQYTNIFDEIEKEAADQRSAEEEAGFRTMEQIRATPESRVERYGTSELPEERGSGTQVVERVPVQPPAEVTPEQVQIEREQAAADEAARQQRVELGKDTEYLRKQKEALDKQAKKKEQAESRKETARRRTIARKLLEENPGKDLTELVPLLRERMAQPQEQAAPATPAPQAAPQPAAVTTPTKNDKDLTDADIGNLASQLGVTLGMRDRLTLEGARNRAAEQEAADTPPPLADVDREAFVTKTKDIVKGLVKKNARNTVDVQNLIQQGKLVFAPTPESIGRPELNNAAEFDPSTNQMYLYTDRVESGDTLGVMARALHEATHAGQFNDRQGRPDIFAQMMSKDNLNAASNKIRTAARNGNKIAQAAVTAAREESPNASIEALELVPYFVTEAVNARGGTLGTMRGVANDVVSSAKKFLKDKFGADFDLTINDLESAAQRVGGEIVETDTGRGQQGETLGMVLGRTARDYNKANKEDRVYRGLRDNQPRFLLSDRTATTNAAPEVIQDLLAGNVLPLGEVLNHQRLYDQYPWLATDVVVRVDDQVAGGGSWQPRVDGKGGTITLPSRTVKQLDTWDARNTLLHETQHAVQNREGMIGGADWNRFIPRRLVQEMQQADQKLDQVIRGFELGAALNTMPPAIRKDVEGVFAERSMSPMQRAEYVLSSGAWELSSDRGVQNYAKGLYARTREQRNEVAKRYKEAERNATLTYARDYGESEARTVERTSRMTQEELESRPFESRFGEIPYNENPVYDVPVEETIDTGSIRTPLSPATRYMELGAIPEAERTPLEQREYVRLGTLGMADRVPVATQPQTRPARQRIPAWFTGLLDSAQGTGRVANEIAEYARTSPAGQRMIAEANLGRYDRELNKLAAQKGMTAEALNAQIAKELDALDKASDSYQQNKANFVEVASKYGKAGQALIDLRNQVDELTLDIVRQRAADGNPLTEAEKKTYATLINNMGRYVHRQYAVNAGQVGDAYASRVWKDYQKYKAGKGTKDPVVEQNYQTVAKAVQYLVDNNLSIPDDKKLAAMGADKLRNIYSVWGKVGNPDGLSLEQMKSELAGIRDTINGDKNRLTNAAEDITQELLNLAPATSPITTFFRGGKIDKGILKERQDVPPELRKLMGEITDPSMRLLLTVGKQAEFVARNKMLMELRNNAPQDIAPPNSAGRVPQGWQKLEGDTWGPLEGYYVSPNMRALIGDTVQQLATFEQSVAMAAHRPSALGNKTIQYALDKWGTLASVSKGLQIVGNPINFLYNFIGAPRMLLSNGNLNPVNTLKAWNTSVDLIAYARNPSKASKEAIRANQFGITDSAFIGEIKNEQYKQLASVIKGMAGKNPSELVARLRTEGVAAKELYAMMDVWSKLANFYQQVDVLSDFYKKEGIKKSAEEIDREAADIVNRTNITYKRAAPLVKAAERLGITQFGTYFYEVFRSEIANVMQGVNELQRAKDAKTAAGKSAMALQGARRLAGQATSWFLTYQASKLASLAVFGDDEDENKAKRALLPEYLRDQDFVIVGKDAKGNPVLFNFARLDPIGPLTDIMRSALHQDSDPAQVAKKMFDLYVAPRVGTQLITALGTMFTDSVRPTREPLVQQLAPEGYSVALKAADQLPGVDDKTSKAWTNVVEAFLPGIATAYRDTNVRPLREDPATTIYNMMTYGGGTMYKLDPNNSLRFASMDYTEGLKNARKDVKEIFTDHPNITAPEVLSRVLEMQVKERENYNELRKVYEGMLAVGQSKREAAKALKDQRVSADAIKSITSGEFQSQIISKSSIDQYAKNDMAGKPRAEKKEIKKKWEDVWDVLKQVQKESKEEEE